MPKNLSKHRAHLFHITVPYTTVSEDTIYVSSLSKLQIQQLHITYSSRRHSLIYNTVKLATNDMRTIQYSELSTVYDLIMYISMPDAKDIDVVTKSLNVLQDKKYQTEDFRDCKTCQKRGMDKSRNCPYLGKDSYSPTVIYTFENDNTKVMRECPMYDVNNSELLSPALDLMRCVEHGVLPITGGMLDQTVFVNEAIPIITPIIDKKKMPMSMGLM